MTVNTRRIVYDFRGAHAPPAVASRLGIWCSKITKTAGTPTVQSQSGGPLELTLDNANEVQNLCLYMGDILPFDIASLVSVEFVAKLSASLAAAVSGAFGIATARNDTLDSVANMAWFRFEGSNAIVCETDDGGSFDLDDKATGFSLAATYRRFKIDFAGGSKFQSPPSLSKGGTADVRFHMSNDRGALTRVASGTNFDLSAFTGNVQLIAQIQKTANAATGTLSILEAVVEHKLSA